jgi:hypothetical protein
MMLLCPFRDTALAHLKDIILRPTPRTQLLTSQSLLEVLHLRVRQLVVRQNQGKVTLAVRLQVALDAAGRHHGDAPEPSKLCEKH